MDRGAWRAIVPGGAKCQTLWNKQWGGGEGGGGGGLLKTTGDVRFLRMNLNLTLSTFFFKWLCGQEVGLLVKEMYPVTLFFCQKYSYNHNKINIIY